MRIYLTARNPSRKQFKENDEIGEMLSIIVGASLNIKKEHNYRFV